MESNTLEGCGANTEAASDCKSTTNSAEDGELNTEAAPNSAKDAELFDWPDPLLSVMKETRETKRPRFMYGAKGVVSRWLKSDGADTIAKELLQYDNPLFKSVLRDIKRVSQQPPMTTTDKRRLHDYKSKHLNDRKQSSLSDKDGVVVFKLHLVNEEAENEARFEVEYTSDSIAYDKVVAITYAWHESADKTDYYIARQDNGPNVTLQLGVEWDVNAVLGTLADLSKDNWIWMDQFSLIQKEVMTEALASDIPAIYRNARVVAFLPYRVCDTLLSRINNFRGSENPCVNEKPVNKEPDVSTALAEVMFHDLVCNCTDGLYGWLSRLWTWQELMLASSLRFVWGLGECEWTRNGYYDDLGPSQRRKEEKDGKKQQLSLSRLCKSAGKMIADILKDSVTSLSVSDQPITKLMNELTKRNTESLIVSKSESATLSVGYYFCMRLLCGAEVFMPSASRTPPINCLKILQQIAHTGRKGGNVHDCYYAALAFIDVGTFLPNKKKPIAERNEKEDTDDFDNETALRAAYIALYEREHAILRLPDQKRAILDDPDKLFEAYTELFPSGNSPTQTDRYFEDFQRKFIDLYHEVNKTTLVKHTGFPVPSKKKIGNDVEQGDPSPNHFHPIGWQTHTQSSRNLKSLKSSLKEKRSLAKFLFPTPAPMHGSLPNAFVLSGLNEEMFCETKDDGENFSGSAYDILSIKRIKVGRKSDLCFNSIRKIAKYLHPSQLSRVRNFITIPGDLRLALFPLAYAIIHATSFKVDPYPTHFLKIFSAFLGSRTKKDYVDAVSILLGENFDFLGNKDDDEQNTFELAKITFADGSCCVGVISRKMKDFIIEDFTTKKDFAIKKSTAFGLLASAVKVVKTHKRLLLCGGVLSDWSVIGYIPGFDAEANEAVLGPVSHSEVYFKRVPGCAPLSHTQPPHPTSPKEES